MCDPDTIRLRHMLDAAREAMAFAHGKTREDMRLDRLLALALTKDIEIIGEAANSVSPEKRASLPGIPWADIVGMRNRLIHAYFEVDLDMVWDVVTADLPGLARSLAAALGLDETESR